jgi:hypothetical protein
MTTLRKPRGRPFQPGNPGRPVGSKNRTTQIATTNQGRRRSAEHGEASHNDGTCYASEATACVITAYLRKIAAERETV